jgi:probable rRNA maturation factor
MSARSSTKSSVNVDVIIASARWTQSLRTPAAIVRRAAKAALESQGPKAAVACSVLLTTDAAVRKLNATFRGKDKPTNVLSFPADAPAIKGQPRALGDIALAYGILAHEARKEGKTLKAHLSHLVAHGVLHLLGYDHGHDQDAVTMERLEKKILARLGIADPYAPVPALPRPRGLKLRKAGRTRR